MPGGYVQSRNYGGGSRTEGQNTLHRGRVKGRDYVRGEEKTSASAQARPENLKEQTKERNEDGRGEREH